MKTLSDLTVKIYADGADKAGMLELYNRPYIKGFTTNPTLMRKARVAAYRAFAKEILSAIPERPISFEVLSDGIASVRPKKSQPGRQRLRKIPVTNTRREPSYDLIRRLCSRR
jgi:transaldolase